MEINKSYISKQESTAIKGVLIFLIVLGHNMLFTYYVEPFQGMVYLYCFHIQSFFILPFLYDSKALSKKRLTNYVVRLYWPYLLLTLLLSVGYYCVYLHNRLDYTGILQMWLTGDVSLLGKYCGVQIFWFMPAMFALSILKDLFYSSGKFIKGVLLALSIGINVYDWNVLPDICYSILPYEMISKLPFGLYLGLPYLIYGVLVRWIIKCLVEHEINVSRILVLIFIVFTIIYFYNVRSVQSESVLFILKTIMPVLFIVLLWYYRNLIVRFSFWEKLGDKSFAIYLIHPFIGYILYGIFVKLNLQLSLGYAIIAQVVMLAGGYYLANLLYHFDRLRKFILPRCIEELVFRNNINK